jgi:hypothetical protein
MEALKASLDLAEKEKRREANKQANKQDKKGRNKKKATV